MRTLVKSAFEEVDTYTGSMVSYSVYGRESRQAKDECSISMIERKVVEVVRELDLKQLTAGDVTACLAGPVNSRKDKLWRNMMCP